MMQPLYIRSAAAISPQYSFDTAQFLNPVLASDSNILYVADPDYRQFINPVAIRRMSRIIKMGISAGMRALQDAGITTPDGIIIGTGKGSVSDTEHFLNDLIKFEEQALNPTYFIQSTYNSVNGWLALQTKCTGYSQTYVHRGHSLEMALLDAQMMATENSKPCNLLVGCLDEMSEDYFYIKSKVGYWKKEPIHSTELLQHKNTAGTIAGEGAAFFTVSNMAEDACCSLHAVYMLQQPTLTEIQACLENALADKGITTADIGLIISGNNGDVRQQALYDTTLPMFPEASVVMFKHLCGEYDTTTGFALWLASYIAQKDTIPEAVIVQHNAGKGEYILILNHNILDSVSILLLKK